MRRVCVIAAYIEFSDSDAKVADVRESGNRELKVNIKNFYHGNFQSKGTTEESEKQNSL